MLLGEYTHTLDDKSRLAFPAKFRKTLGKRVVVTHGLDHCLFVYPEKQWQLVTKKLGELSLGQADSRGFNRFLLAGAVEAEFDQAGRVLLPEYLRAFAGLKSKAAVIGVGDRVEIWNEKAWTEYKASVEGAADRMAEKLSELGAL